MSSTVYRLAQEHELALLLALSKPTAPIGWPNVIAMRGNELLGFILTQDRDEAVIVGPLWFSDGLKQKAFVALRLFEVYERIMGHIGICKYLFYIDNDDSWINLMLKLPGFAIIEKQAKQTWFERRIQWVAAAM